MIHMQSNNKNVVTAIAYIFNDLMRLIASDPDQASICRSILHHLPEATGYELQSDVPFEDIRAYVDYIIDQQDFPSTDEQQHFDNDMIERYKMNVYDFVKKYVRS